MAIRKVARMGHPILRQMATEVPAEAVAGPEVQRLIDDLLETVRDYDGAGLAAPQVHSSLRVVVLQLDASRGFDVWINPVITPLTDDLVCTVEGCLSVPGLRGIVCRPGAVRVEALDRFGAAVVLELSGFPAVVAQHECDHLDGALYVDQVEPETLAFIEEFHRFIDQDGEE
jgi:peptide deformylase